MRRLLNTHVSALPFDLVASLVVFLVALPLCMGIAVASGAPPGAGLITGIVGGLVVGWIAGCPLQVSGPAAGLSVIVWELIHSHGIETLGIVVLAAGLLQLLAGCLQLGQWFRAVSPAVIYGMLSGIGALILTSQLHVMIDETPKGSGLENLLSIPEAVAKAWQPLEGGSHQAAAVVGLLTIGVILLWEHLAPGRLRVIPAVLVGVLVATVTAGLWDLPVNRIYVRDDVFALIQPPSPAHLLHLTDTKILAAALAVAFIASVETLLSATAVDHLHAGPRTRYSRELLAQGFGNVLCGLLGALPMTGVIVRSSASIQAGARTRLAAVLHGAWLLLFVAFLPFVLRWIPTASLAAVLVYTGYKLMHLEALRELRRHGDSEVGICLGTLTAIVASNLLTGVLVGVGLALAKLLYTTQNLETEISSSDGAMTVHLRGVATFVSLPRLATALEEVPPRTPVHLDVTSLRHIDHACLQLLQSWQRLHETNGGSVQLDWRLLQARTYQTRRHRRHPAPAAGAAAAARAGTPRPLPSAATPPSVPPP